MIKQNIQKFAKYATEGRVVVFDTETTGCSSSDEICQIAAAEFVNGTLARTLCLYVCPTCEMNPWAEQVHGITMDYLYEFGVDPEAAMREFYAFLGNDVLLVAHNNRFDMKMLRQECAKFDLAFAPEGVELCDTLALSRYFKPDLKSHSLGFLVEALGVKGVNSHDALDDTLACAAVFFKLLEAQRSGV